MKLDFTYFYSVFTTTECTIQEMGNFGHLEGHNDIILVVRG